MLSRALRYEELWPGEMRGCVLEGEPVLLVNNDGKIAAFRDRCAHLGVTLSKGRLEGERIICHAHCWEYDACTGQGTNPTGTQLQQFEVRVENGVILVAVEGTRP